MWELHKHLRAYSVLTRANHVDMSYTNDLVVRVAPVLPLHVDGLRSACRQLSECQLGTLLPFVGDGRR